METIKVKYKDLSTFEFNQALAKVANAQLPTAKALAVRKILKGIQEVREQMSKDYKQNILEKYAQKDEKDPTKFAHPENDPNGFIFSEENQAVMMKENEAFGDTEVTVNAPFKLNETLLEGVKFSARELEMLNFIMSEEAGPGVPTDVPNLRRV